MERPPTHKSGDISRRTALRAALSVMAVGFPAGAKAKEGGVYFVPSGRIGFKRPAEIAPWSNVWALLSTDHTFQVRITEVLRHGPYNEAYLWDKDYRSELIPTNLEVPGVDVRCFRDKRYEPSNDYSAQSIALRDSEWIGNLDVSTNNWSGSFSSPAGQIARWRTLADSILASIVVRPMLPAKAALAELFADLDIEGLNPRFIGESLILSLNPEGWKVEHPIIRIEGLPFIAPGRSAEDRAAVISEIYDIARRDPSCRPIDGAQTRGLISPERESILDTFITDSEAYSKTRHVRLSAWYKAEERVALLDALRRVHQSLVMHDWPDDV